MGVGGGMHASVLPSGWVCVSQVGQVPRLQASRHGRPWSSIWSPRVLEPSDRGWVADRWPLTVSRFGGLGVSGSREGLTTCKMRVQGRIG